jgi:DNA-binding IscR family transcriptional regulator
MLALLTMQIAGKAFLEGREGPNVDQLAPSMGLPASLLAPVLRQLEESRLLRATEDQVVVPARSMDRITLQDIVNSVRDYPSDALPSHPDLEQIQALLARVDGAIESSMGGRTLRDLVGESQDNPGDDSPPGKD